MNKFQKIIKKLEKSKSDIIKFKNKLDKIGTYDNYELLKKKLNRAIKDKIYCNTILKDIIISDYIKNNIIVGTYLSYNYDKGYNKNSNTYNVLKIRRRYIYVESNEGGYVRSTDMSYKDFFEIIMFDKYNNSNNGDSLKAKENTKKFLENELQIRIRDETINFLLDE
jgi:hypothetical protein